MRKLLVVMFAAFMSVNGLYASNDVIGRATENVVVEKAAVEPVSVIAIAKMIREAINVALDVYKNAPDAEYYLMYKAKDGKVAYLKADSAVQLINMAVVALENGKEEAEWVVLSSVYPSVKGFCIDWGKKYTKANVGELLQCL